MTSTTADNLSSFSPVSSKPSTSFVSLILIFLSPALGGLLFGYDIGATSFVISMLNSSSSSSQYWWSIVSSSSSIQGLIVSSASLGALIGSVIVFAGADMLGRRLEIRFAALIYLIGALLNLFSGTWLKNSTAFWGVSCLVIGRIVYGVGIGFAMHGAPTYMAEMAPPSIRGIIVTAKEAFIMLGVITGYGSGYLLFKTSENHENWYLLYCISMFISFPMLLLSLFIPRSVRWLLLYGFEEEAYQSLQFIYNGQNVRQEFETIKDQVKEQQNQTNAMVTDDDHYNHAGIFSKSKRKALQAGIGLVILQQITGQPSILSYVTIIFQNAGLDSSSSVFVALFMFTATCSTVLTVDRFGRKKLLYTGCGMMCIALFVLSIAFHHYDVLDENNNSNNTSPNSTNNGMTPHKIIILISMFLYIGGYQVGFGPITWLILSEVFPLETRGQAVAFGVQMNFALNFLVQFVVPVIEDVLGLSATFGMFGILAAYSLFFVSKFVPETKGLSLEEIESYMKTFGVGSEEESRALFYERDGGESA